MSHTQSHTHQSQPSSTFSLVFTLYHFPVLRPHVPDDPRSCQMDGCAVLNQYRFLILSVYLQKTSGRTLRWFCQPWEIFCVVMMTLGGGRAIITLRAVDRDRGGGTWAMTGCCDNVVVRPSLRQSGYERRVTCIRMVIRASCHHEVRGTCSQEEGSLHPGPSTTVRSPSAAGSWMIRGRRVE
ncbi:hypothetical protein CK203_060779 [Vitis vinifera]|uniref:Uncharacterized protein n=1 Tax=Vitis vinifera TaxID=29760 RepID=A0A438FUQ4_VITVI|nr:hypothetical protein CK203_060779 [Vitis vinifera]